MRIGHCMIRVGDLRRSLEFYVDLLGMTLFRQEDYPKGRFTLAFVGFGDAKTSALLELTHNWDIASYSQGDGFGHLALEVDDVVKTCDLLAEVGVNIVRPPGPMTHASPERERAEVIAFIEDPDGYRIELVERDHNDNAM